MLTTAALADDLKIVAGGADQTKLLQRGLDEAAESGRPFVLPAGTFITRTLVVADGCHVIGRPGRTVLALSGNGPLLSVSNAKRITLQGLTLEGVGRRLEDGVGLLSASDVADLRVDDCVFQNSGGEGIRLERSGGRIERSRIIATKRGALFSIDATGLTIAENRIDASGDNGVQIWRSTKGDDGTSITGNRISDIRADSGGTGEYGNGISLYRAGGVIVANNQIRRCRYSAVRNNGGSNVQISGNTCIDFDESAIWHEFGFDGGTVANNIIQNAMIGVIVTNYGSDNGRLATITGNIIRNCTRRTHIGDGQIGGGIGIKAEGEVALTGNVIDACDFAGIQLGWGTALKNAVVTGNMLKVSEIGIGISVVNGAGDATITGNVIQGAKRAIVGMEGDKVITDDLSTGGAGRFPQLMLSANTVR